MQLDSLNVDPTLNTIHSRTLDRGWRRNKKLSLDLYFTFRTCGCPLCFVWGGCMTNPKQARHMFHFTRLTHKTQQKMNNKISVSVANTKACQHTQKQQKQSSKRTKYGSCVDGQQKMPPHKTKQQMNNKIDESMANNKMCYINTTTNEVRVNTIK